VRGANTLIEGFAILTGFYFLGEVIRSVFCIPIPGNVLGMILIVIALKLQIVKLEHVERASTLLLDNLMFLFVPTTVAIMLYFDIIREQWLVMIGVTVVSTFLVAFMVGKTADLLLSRRNEGEHDAKRVNS
jgi:holin-like protein